MDLEKYLKQYSKYQNQIDFISRNYSHLDDAIRKIDQTKQLENLATVTYMLNIQDSITKKNYFINSYDSLTKFYRQRNIADITAFLNSNAKKIQQVQSLIEKANLQKYSNILFDLKIRSILNYYNDLENISCETSDKSQLVSVKIKNASAKLNELLNLKKLITIEDVTKFIAILLLAHSLLMMFCPNLRGEAEYIHNFISELSGVVLLLITKKPRKD